MHNEVFLIMLDLTDRKCIFYWQTDRNLSAEDYLSFFLKRQEVSEDELVTLLKKGISSISDIKDVVIEPIDESLLKGNVNIVRKVRINDKPYVVRVHPKGVRNGYFYVEKIAQRLAKAHGVPSSQTLEVHEAIDESDMDFALVTKEEGEAIDVYLQKYQEKKPDLLFSAGFYMAKLHEIHVSGYGAFSNAAAKRDGALVGLHKTYKDFVHTGLVENLERLVRFEILSKPQTDKMRQVFDDNNFEPPDGPRLIHNDYADWNLLTDGNVITSVLDWDECHAGDPIADLACWSTFFDIERLSYFLKGYTSVTTLPDDYEKRFHYYRLRYTISKMALRIKRYQIDKSEFILEKISVGKRALEQETSWFSI